MHKKRIIVLFLVLFIHALTANLSAQVRKPDSIPEPVAEVTQEEPVEPKPISIVDIKDDLLSVELVDAEFGGVLRDIARKAGFKVEIGGDVNTMKLNTKFSNMEIERGIERLLTLVREKNYLVHYDTKGAVSSIEIYGGLNAPVAAPKPQTPARPQAQRPARTAPVPAAATAPRRIVTPPPAPAVQTPPPLNQRRILSPIRASQQEAMRARREQIMKAREQENMSKSPAQDNISPEGTSAQDAPTEENVNEIPYVPSPQNPNYIPPRTQ